MKLAPIALLAVLAVTNAASGELMRRDLRVETSGNEASASDLIEADLRDDDLGADEDFWDSWDNHYGVHADADALIDPCCNDTGSASGGSAHAATVGDIPSAAKDLLEKAELVATAALPFSIKHAESMLLPACLVVAALFVVAFAAVLIGVRRQQLSEPMFGPVELASDLPEPMTTLAGSDADSDSPSLTADKDGDEADTGATVLADSVEEEKEEEEADFSPA
ncbi:unnamed protein product [Phytophthora lilii]|uniref:Unnamed protein product n=1 Tax=Phytophthora lilii TaxID=2077276 RepID=A0A9W6U5A2_9STRA|nr:unnamed protein product [Phytophthora lilii]